MKALDRQEISGGEGGVHEARRAEEHGVMLPRDNVTGESAREAERKREEER